MVGRDGEALSAVDAPSTVTPHLSDLLSARLIITDVVIPSRDSITGDVSAGPPIPAGISGCALRHGACIFSECRNAAARDGRRRWH